MLLSGKMEAALAHVLALMTRSAHVQCVQCQDLALEQALARAVGCPPGPHTHETLK